MPLLAAISDNGPQMRSYSTTRGFLAAVAIAQQFGRPHAPTDQAWIETLFGHVKGEWPHLQNCNIERFNGSMAANYSTASFSTASWKQRSSSASGTRSTTPADPTEGSVARPRPPTPRWPGRT